jgi:hypothetical protein
MAIGVFPDLAAVKRTFSGHTRNSSISTAPLNATHHIGSCLAHNVDVPVHDFLSACLAIKAINGINPLFRHILQARNKRNMRMRPKAWILLSLNSLSSQRSKTCINKPWPVGR